MNLKIFFFIVVIASVSNFKELHSQWIQQYPVTPFNHLYDVHFVNNMTGWTCGNLGRIMRTTNGGLNWETQDSGVPGEILNRIFAVDSEVVYCTGYFETILKTTNGGVNWIIIRHSTEQAPSFFGLFFIDRNTGWLAKDRYILKTTDGGSSFDSTYLTDVRHNFDIFFRNYSEGLACGEGGKINRTTNGGIVWNEILIAPNYFDDFSRLTFINSNTGYTQGNFGNKVFKTTDFGLTWDSISTIWEADDSYCIFFSNELTGYSGGAFGKMFKTTNGGYNWVQQDMSQFNIGFINDIWFYDQYTGWAIGSGTKILFTSNGGSTFIDPLSNHMPESFMLFQNYPNPFNPSTNIKFDLPQAGFVKLTVFDILGREVAVLVNEKLNAGTYNYQFSIDNFQLKSGVYFYKLESGEFVQTRKMVLVK